MPTVSALPSKSTPLSRSVVLALRAVGALTAPVGHKGLYRIARWLTPYACRGRSFEISVPPGIRLELPVAAYWLRLNVPSYVYEPELERVLTQIEPVDYGWLDCGANIGYWSARVGHASLGAKRGVAVEAGSEAYALLARNLASGGVGITPLHVAIGKTDDSVVSLNFRDGEFCDAGALISESQAPDASRTRSEQVRTITFDTLLARHFPDPSQPIVIKLDIEGMEVEVIRESRRMAERDCLVIAEDHGKDAACTVTAALLHKGFDVACIDDVAGGFWVADLERLAAIKTNPGKGYNVCAVRQGSRFRPHLDRLVAG